MKDKIFLTINYLFCVVAGLVITWGQMPALSWLLGTVVVLEAIVLIGGWVDAIKTGKATKYYREVNWTDYGE